MIHLFAITCGWVGEKDLAFEQLAKAAELPGPIYYGIHSGILRLHPFWDPLRGDARFDKIVAGLGPIITPPAPEPAFAPLEKSIAVLPFLDLSPAKDQQYFCDGMSEQILDSLSKIEGLQVVARTSSFSIRDTNLDVKEIARKLGVGNLVEGSLRRDGNQIRVTVQLVKASDGFHLWSETYEREIQGVFAVQDEITQAITSALKLKLVGAMAAPTQNAEAYELYLQGLFFSNKSTEEGLRKSLEFFERSLEKDPDSARTYAGIAKVWNWLGDAYVKPLDAFPKMKAAALKAVALDEKLAEGHLWLGNARRILDWDVAGCWKEIDRAVELDPNSAAARSIRTLGDLCVGDKKKALADIQASVRLDPLSPIVSNFAAVAYLCAGEVDEAIAEGKRLMLLDPNYIYESPVLGDAYCEKGMYPEAVATFQRAQQLTGATQPGLAITYARIGRKVEARQILEELRKIAATKHIPAEEIAAVYVALGEKDEAFKWLERGYAEHGGAFHAIAILPNFRALHSDPRFQDILRRIGLDPARVFVPVK
jgi:TolB-like protein/Flp pilus assembly protein TadD